jgi:hypothetical protein
MAWRKRRGGNPDTGQVAGVDRLRHVFGDSITVVITTIVGFGFGDLVIGFMDETIIVEWKRKGGKLRPGQDTFRKQWRGGPYVKCDDVDDLVQKLLQVAKVRGGPHALDLDAITRRASEATATTV